MSTTPEPTSDDARLVACWLEPHWVSTVVLATLSGRSSRQPGRTADVEGLLADLADAAGDDLADLGGIDPVAVDDRPLHAGEGLGGVKGGQSTVALPDRGAEGIDDHDI
jgi:hypothetical protein